MGKLSQILRAFTEDKRGSVFIIVAVSVSTLVVSVMIAIEASHYMQVKSKVRNALDQSLLAAAATSENTATMRKTMINFFNANMGETSQGVEVTGLDIQKLENPTRWTAQATVKIDMIMAGVGGIDSVTATHSGSVAWDESVLNELVAMVDVSGTMCANFGRQTGLSTAFVPDRNCTKLRYMRDALTEIVDIGVGVGSLDAVFKVGLVPFSFKVNLPNPNAVASVAPFLLAGENDAAAVSAANNPPITADAAYFTDVSNAEPTDVPLPMVLPLRSISSTTSKIAFVQAVNGLVSGNTAENEFQRPFMKRSSLGAHISALMLDPRYNALFGGERPQAFGAQKVNKTVIMMTDSANLGCCYTNWPDGNFRNNYIYSYKPDHEHLVGPGGNGQGICKQMKDAGITVFTVLLDVDEADMTARGREIIDSYEQCATTSAHAFRVGFNDSRGLEVAYSQIGASLKNLRLTE